MARRTPEQWQQLIAERVESGLTPAEYCRQRHLNREYFYSRRKQLGFMTEGSAFVAVKPTNKAAVVFKDIRLRYGFCELLLDTDVDTVWFADFVKALA